MTALIAAGLALIAGVGSLLLRWRFSNLATLVGTAGLIAVAAVGLSIRAEDVRLIGEATIAGSDALRRFTVLWAISGLALTAVDAVSVRSHAVAGPALVGLGTAILALAVPDAGTAFAFLAAGGVVAILGPAVAAARPRASVAWLALRSTIIAAFMGLGLVAWGASAIGPLSGGGLDGGADPAFETAVGLGLVAIGVAVGLRMGAIPTHVWAARLVEAIPAPAIPAALAWGGAAFGLVGLGWAETTIGSTGLALSTERAIVLAIAASSILLGAVAAFLHDDLEHILGYSLVQDAGIVLLAFVVPEPGRSGTVMTWVLGYAVAKSALAAFVAVVRSTFGTRRVADLGGWARSAPVLAMALLLTTVAVVGLPGTAAFDARAALIDGAAGGLLGQILLLGALAPIVYLGRVGYVGLGRASETVRHRAPAAVRSQPEPLAVARRASARGDGEASSGAAGATGSARAPGTAGPAGAATRLVAAVATIRARAVTAGKRVMTADTRDRDAVAASLVAVLAILAVTVSLAGV